MPDTVTPSPEHGGAGGELEPPSRGENLSLAGRCSWPGPTLGEQEIASFLPASDWFSLNCRGYSLEFLTLSFEALNSSYIRNNKEMTCPALTQLSQQEHPA